MTNDQCQISSGCRVRWLTPLGSPVIRVVDRDYDLVEWQAVAMGLGYTGMRDPVLDGSDGFENRPTEDFPCEMT
jgi:hypothetical protein